MRMWMVEPAVMCDQHLLGEHVELHMLAGTLARKRSIDGFIANGLLEPESMHERHLALADEMLRRGFRHKSPLPEVDLAYLPAIAVSARVDAVAAARDLGQRCARCRARGAVE
jgi:hypothetical protein